MPSFMSKHYFGDKALKNLGLAAKRLHVQTIHSVCTHNSAIKGHYIGFNILQSRFIWHFSTTSHPEVAH